MTIQPLAVAINTLSPAIPGFEVTVIDGVVDTIGSAEYSASSAGELKLHPAMLNETAVVIPSADCSDAHAKNILALVVTAPNVIPAGRDCSAEQF